MTRMARYYSVYVTIQEQHRPVQHGIYGVVRNPIYLGTMLAWPGTCLVSRSWLVFPVFLYFLTFAVLRGARVARGVYLEVRRLLRPHMAARAVCLLTVIECYIQRVDMPFFSRTLLTEAHGDRQNCFR